MWCIMKVEKLNSTNSWQNAENRKRVVTNHYPVTSSGSVSFKGDTSKLGKHFWRYLRQLGKSMNEITEIKNALIAAIGTGVIAPAVILVSPGKGDEDDKNKKKLQALRQPISALLQFGFQVPATVWITRKIDSLSYEKKIKLFKDDVIGDLIPTEKYLSKGVKKEEIEALSAKFDEVIDGKSLRQELENIIKEDYEQVELGISDSALERKVNRKKKKFLKKKVAQVKLAKLKEEKIQDILNHPEKYPKFADIKDIDLVSEDIQKTIVDTFSKELKQIEKDCNLSFFDRVVRVLGFETAKTKEVEARQLQFKKDKGLEELKKLKPEIFKDNTTKLKHYVETYQKEAQELFKRKKFGFSLMLNLFMVAVSCYVLNWLHPRINSYIENLRAEKNKNPKVEVA